jgi:hypothetical protein
VTGPDRGEPNPDNPPPPAGDFGVPGPDFGVPGPDFGVPGPDFGVPGPDFGVPGPDFGVPGPERGELLPNATDDTVGSFHVVSPVDIFFQYFLWYFSLNSSSHSSPGKVSCCFGFTHDISPVTLFFQYSRLYFSLYFFCQPGTYSSPLTVDMPRARDISTSNNGYAIDMLEPTFLLTFNANAL